MHISKEPECLLRLFLYVWEQRTVGEYYEFKNGLNKGKEYFGAGTPIVNFTDVFHQRGIYEENLKGRVNLTKSEIANFQVRVGDIFFTRTSEAIEEIGFPSVMLDDPKDTVFSGFVLRGRAIQNDPLTLLFKRYVFFTDAFRNEMLKKSSMTTRALTSGTAIKDMLFIFPKNKEEQNFIGAFFHHLDRLITLHQRSCNLTPIKPACGFPLKTIAWEQRKLGEIADKVTEKNTTLRYTEALTNSAEFGIIGQRDFFDHDVAKLSSLHGYYIVKKDDFVYNPRISVTAPVGPVNRNKLGKTGVVSPLYTVLRTAQIDNEFLEWFFKSACWHSFMIFNGDSGARSDRFSIKNSTFFEMPIPCPCRMEQSHIGAFFRHLGRLITLHQRKRFY